MKSKALSHAVRRGVLVPASCALLLASCNLPTPQADSVRYFTLSEPAAAIAVPDAPSVRPVRLAGHLRNRAMAVRVSENEVVYLEDVRWAEPLDEAVTQVLRHRLRQVGGGGFVNVSVQRCELVRSEGNAVQLTATFSVAPLSGELTKTGAFTASPRNWDGKDYGNLVKLLHEAISELAEVIAQTAEQK